MFGKIFDKIVKDNDQIESHRSATISMEEKTHFSILFEEYANQLGLTTNKDLANFLTDNGYPINHSTISKYKSGTRSVNAEFIYYVSRILDLTDDQVKALIYSHFADNNLKFLREFEQIRRLDQNVY